MGVLFMVKTTLLVPLSVLKHQNVCVKEPDWAVQVSTCELGLIALCWCLISLRVLRPTRTKKLKKSIKGGPKFWRLIN